MSDFSRLFSRLQQDAEASFIRYLLVLEGDVEWARLNLSTTSLFNQQTLWVGEQASEPYLSCSFRQAKQWLGQENRAVIFNAHPRFDADALGAIVGTIVGGGGLVLLLPKTEQHTLPLSLQRLLGLFDQHQVVHVKQGQPLPLPYPAMPPYYNEFGDEEFGCLSEEQLAAVLAIRKVVTGHRKRPLVLTADRGRGKSTALGIAAASLLRERRITIAVTAPSFASARQVFRHAAAALDIPLDGNALSYEQSQLMFIAPDALLADPAGIDVVIVDEAAAIPAQLLHGLLQRFNRLVFASTIHGYEGTGRGFEIKFKAELNRQMPQWRGLQMQQPIRWAQGCPLEHWLYQTLLLDAEPHALPAELALEDIAFAALSPSDLVSDESQLAELFGLLVNAHYQTSPNDLIALLDDPAMQVIVAKHNQYIVGCCLVSREGEFSSELAEQILLGKRRPRGHLMAQSLLAHLGLQASATNKGGRIVRIAVHPELQSKGVGSALLGFTKQWAEQQRFDYLGTSFGCDSQLIGFWQRAGFAPIRLGFTKDAASGLHSLLCLQPLTEEACSWSQLAIRRFNRSFPSQALEQYRDLDTQVFIRLYQMACITSPHVDEVDGEFLDLYVAGGLGYDVVVAELETAILNIITSASPALDEALCLCVAKIIQRQPWRQIQSTFNLAGKRQAEQALRDAITCLVKN